MLIAGSILSLLTAIAGGVVAWQHWHDGTVFDAATSRSFGIIVGIEFALAGLGAALLAAFHKAQIIPAWIALVVGVHLIPVAWILRYPLIFVVGALVTLMALAAVPVARARSLAVSAVTGLGTGTVLLGGALVSLANSLS